MNRTEKRAALLKEAADLVTAAKAAVRGLTDDERATIEANLKAADELEKETAREKADSDMLAKLDALGGTEQKSGGEPNLGQKDPAAGAKSLGEFFAKSVTPAELGNLRNRKGFQVATPEFKAATDVHTTPQAFTDTVLQTVDTSFVRPYRRPLVSDLLGSGQLAGTSVKYMIEGPIEGAPTTVAHGAEKPQLHLGNPSFRVDFVTKIAAWWDMEDEMVEDLPFWVSEINGRGLRLLAEVEEQQLLRGDGVGSNLLGILRREGVQQITGAAPAQDVIYKGITAVQSATGLSADGLIIHPEDYQALRLSKDANGQYFGGGFFQNQYGNGGIAWQPDIWGLKTVVSAAAEKGKPIVGALKAATTVYRKGGIRVESTNSDRDKFTRDVVTTRIEERLALAVRNPAAIAVVTLPAA